MRSLLHSTHKSRISVACLWLALLQAFITNTPAVAQTATAKATGFQSRVFKDAAGSHKYAVFVPHAYTPAKAWPVILFLHGAGERGCDGWLPIQYGLGPLIKLREASFPFIAVFPQCEDLHGRILKGWSLENADGPRALKILEQVEQEYKVDTKREILTGWSMGGYGAWEMAAAFPERWHAIVPLAGGGDVATGEKLKSVPVWAWHGATDKIVLPDASRKMVEAVKAAGGNPRFSELADADHDVWKQAYDDDRLYAWMLNPQVDPDKLPLVTARSRGPLVIPEPPFIPAVELPRVAHVRLGNEMLATLADSIPLLIPPDALVGSLGNISDSTSAEGIDFQVSMYNLTYQGQVMRARVVAYARDRLNIQLALSQVVVTIGGTSLSGRKHSAEAGPIQIGIGHQRPVWLSFDVTPTVVDRKLRFRHVGTYFSIPNDNWYVTAPAGVSTRGLGMTEAKVSRGLVSGLYGKKATLEQQVAGVIPRLIAELEQRFDANSLGSALGSENSAGTTLGIWPLPVYKPRLKFWPMEASTDEQGVTLVMGATAAAIDTAHAPAKLRIAPLPSIGAAAFSQSAKLQVGFAPQMLAPLSELMVEADVARIHVADTPSKAMAQLADATLMSEAIPDLKQYGDQLQVWTELALTGPISVIDQTGGRPALDASQVKLVVSIKSGPAEVAFRPCVEFVVKVRQPFAASLATPTELTRAVSLTLNDKASIEVEGKFIGGYAAKDVQINNDKVMALFAVGWEEFIHGGGPLQMEVPDIDLGYAKLRMDSAGWKAPNLIAGFGPPGVKVTNRSEKPLTYETKGLYSDWGGPYTLKPGATHDYPVSSPLLVRLRSEAGEQKFTLPVGSHSDYRKSWRGTPEEFFRHRD